jgi:hypothetical protein
MDKFKAYRIREADKKAVGGFEEMRLDDLDPGEVVVRVAYSSVNYKDALAATGAGRIIRRFPCVGGIDLSGTVTESSDSRFKRGDAVICTSYDMGVAHDGGYSEYARVPADWAVPIPKGMSLFEAMALGTAGYTAALAIVRMEANGLAPANGPVVVSGATGGVGSLAIDMLSRLGYAVTALTGKDGETDYLKKLGAKDVMSRKSLDLTKIKPLDLGRSRRQPGRGGARLDGEHHDGRRYHRRDRPRREHEPQHHRRALHPARGEPAGHRLGDDTYAPAPPGVAAARERPAAAPPQGHDAHDSFRRASPGLRGLHQGRRERPRRGRHGRLR